MQSTLPFYTPPWKGLREWKGEGEGKGEWRREVKESRGGREEVKESRGGREEKGGIEKEEE